jgi:plasmid maintenance system antidote protein VapI
MALRLFKTLGRSPESRLAMQNNYDLWRVRKTLNVDEIERLEIVI